MPSLWDKNYHNKVMKMNINNMNYRERHYYEEEKRIQREEEKEKYIKKLEMEKINAGTT